MEIGLGSVKQYVIVNGGKRRAKQYYFSQYVNRGKQIGL